MSPADDGLPNAPLAPGAMPYGGDTAAKADSSTVEEVLRGVRLLLRQLDSGPRPSLAAVVWPEGLDRRHLGDMPLATRTRNCLRNANLFSRTAALTMRDLLLPNFGARTLKELLVEIERFLKALADDPMAYVPAAMRPELLELARRTGTAGQPALIELAKSASGLRSPFANLRARVSAIVAALSPAERAAVGYRLLEEPQPTFAEIGKRLGVSHSRAQQLHATVERRVRLAVEADAAIAASILKRRLGHLVDGNAFRRHLDTVLGRDDGLAVRLLRKTLLEQAGYVLARGVYLDDEAGAVIETLRAHADDAGLVDESELLALLPDRDWRRHWQVLLGHAGLHPVDRHLAIRRNGEARVKAALLSMGRPATREEIADVSGLTGAHVGNCLSKLRSVVRATKEHWALRDWVDGEYESIPKAIIQRIREGGGATATERLLAELPSRFGVSAGSVRTYLKTPRFVVREGCVSLADAVAHGRDLDGAPCWTFRVQSRFLEGFSFTGLPPEFAKVLGCEPDAGTLVRVDNLPKCRELSVHWRLASATGASLGRIADALRALRIRPGESSARVTVKGPRLVGLTAVGKAAADTADGG